MASLSLPYCGSGAPGIDTIWIDNGFSPCFVDTVSSATAFFFTFFVGGTYAFTVKAVQEDRRTPTQKIAQGVQTLLFVLAAFISISRLISVSAVEQQVLEVNVVFGTMYTGAYLATALQLSGRRKKGVPGAGILTYFFIWELLRIGVEIASYKSKHYFFSVHDSVSSSIELGCFTATAMAILISIAFETVARLPSLSARKVDHDDFSESGLVNDEREPLLTSGHQQGHGHGRDQGVGVVKQRTGSTFSGFTSKVKLLWPYLWPRGHVGLQLRIVLCVAILVSIRVVNVLVPLWYKRIIDRFDSQRRATPLVGQSESQGNGEAFPWDDILIYVLLRYLQGGGIGSMGLLSNLQTFLWIDVQQFTSRSIRTRLFTHFHNQDLKWHLSRKTGEVLRMMERGSTSINNLLSYVLFNIMPTLVDIGIAVAYFTAAFGVYYGLIVFVTMGTYIWITVAVTEWRTKFRREMNTRDNAVRQKATDSLLNAETVKLYSGEKFEAQTYLEKVLDYQKHEWRSLASLSLLNCTQSSVIAVGLAAGAMLCGYEVSTGERTVGDFVMFITYVTQLYAPLNWFGTYFRMIQAAFVDMENMIDLFEIKPTVVDKPGATALVPHRNACGIEFKNVSFAYEPTRPILRNISFTVAPGTTCAIVGSTGSGKSTIMRMLFRFYDVDSGSIVIDGQDIANCTLESVRGIMGVVPQDTVLFHDTIRYNVRYGRMDAADTEVDDAARGAEILESISTFPNGFDTIVGERGLKLSGGEKQRVAIARTILKRPLIVMLDEATSALDTETERAIQESLDKVCTNRTSLVIAHRLSTVVHADEIVVLREGEIVERGVHADLLQNRGAYFDMWNAQAAAIEDAQDADVHSTTTA